VGQGSGKKWLVIGGVSAVALVGGCALCGLGGWALWASGSQLLEEQVAADLRDNPVIVEHIGTIQTLELDPMAAPQHTGPEDNPYRIVGTKGTGVIVVSSRTVSGDVEVVESGTLYVDGGGSYDLFPQGRFP